MQTLPATLKARLQAAQLANQQTQQQMGIAGKEFQHTQNTWQSPVVAALNSLYQPPQNPTQKIDQSVEPSGETMGSAADKYPDDGIGTTRAGSAPFKSDVAPPLGGPGTYQPSPQTTDPNPADSSFENMTSIGRMADVPKTLGGAHDLVLNPQTTGATNPNPLSIPNQNPGTTRNNSVPGQGLNTAPGGEVLGSPFPSTPSKATSSWATMPSGSRITGADGKTYYKP